MNLDIPTPEWAIPLLQPSRFKVAKGGRASGKSHFFAERLVEHSIVDPDLAIVCVRETQKSLKFSAKRLVEGKIEAMGVGHLFEVRHDLIKRKDGTGVIIFQGMSDSTADSIKSLEGFGIAWCEEGQVISQRSLDLLIPTIRTEGSEIWVSYNPDQATDPVDNYFLSDAMAHDTIQVHINFDSNPFCPQVVQEEAARHLLRDPDTYAHVWMGQYNTKSDDQVLAGKWVVDEFEVSGDWDGPYHGADWGFSTDPNALVKLYIYENNLYVAEEQYGHGIEVNDTPAFFGRMPSAQEHVVRADSARPEIISYMRKHGYPRIQAAQKWPGSIEDGISTLRGFDNVVIHPQCPHFIDEARLYKYKRDRLTDDILPVVIDRHNHLMDAARYALEPITKRRSGAVLW